jgi:hypothetical protein
MVGPFTWMEPLRQIAIPYPIGQFPSLGRSSSPVELYGERRSRRATKR